MGYMNVVYAMSALVLFTLIEITLLVLGDQTTRLIVLVALFFGALSQFLAQDGRPFVVGIASALSWASMATTIAAFLWFALSHG